MIPGAGAVRLKVVPHGICQIGLHGSFHDRRGLGYFPHLEMYAWFSWDPNEAVTGSVR